MKSMCKYSEINIMFCVGIVDIQIDIQNIVYSADTDSKVVKSNFSLTKGLSPFYILLVNRYSLGIAGGAAI